MYKTRSNYHKQYPTNPNNKQSQYKPNQNQFQSSVIQYNQNQNQHQYQYQYQYQNQYQNQYKQKYQTKQTRNKKQKLDECEANRQQSRSILKQITDKYGFYWDNKGKLLKNQYTVSNNNNNNNININKSTNNIKSKFGSDQQKIKLCKTMNVKDISKINNTNNNKNDNNININSIVNKKGRQRSITLQKQNLKVKDKDKDKQNVYDYCTNSHSNKNNNNNNNNNNKKYVFQQHLIIKAEINQIDQKINSIVSKYRPTHKQKNQVQQDYASKSKNKRIRTFAEQQQKQSPHFCTDYSVKNYITRSKSTNMLPNQKLQRNHSKKLLQNYTYTQKKPQTQTLHRNNSNNILITKLNLQQLPTKYKKLPTPNSNIPIIAQNQNQNQKQKSNEINAKIDKITQKIKQCQKQKQKLNLQFKRFDIRQKSKTPQKLRIRTKTLEQQGVSKNFFRQNNKQKLCVNANYNKLGNIQVLQKQQYPQNVQQKQQKCIPKNQKAQKSQQTIPYLSSSSSPPSSQNKNNKKQKQSIIKKFCHQIQLDEQFRNAKLWFENNQDPHKWGIIADKLSCNGKQYKYHDLVSKFSCSLQQRNPFFSVKDCHESYASLLSTFMEHQRYWEEQIKNKFFMEDLVNQQFSTRQLDIQQKGFVKVQDFVRYINMRTKNFYRSRDLLLLFERFAGKDRKEVHFSKVLEDLLLQSQC